MFCLELVSKLFLIFLGTWSIFGITTSFPPPNLNFRSDHNSKGYTAERTSSITAHYRCPQIKPQCVKWSSPLAQFAIAHAAKSPHFAGTGKKPRLWTNLAIWIDHTTTTACIPGMSIACMHRCDWWLCGRGLGRQGARPPHAKHTCSCSRGGVADEFVGDRNRAGSDRRDSRKASSWLKEGFINLESRSTFQTTMIRTTCCSKCVSSAGYVLILQLFIIKSFSLKYQCLCS